MLKQLPYKCIIEYITLIIFFPKTNQNNKNRNMQEKIEKFK